MKTRREFMRFTLGGLACLGAAVMAPKSLLSKGTENPFNLDNVKEGLRKMDYVTSGYAQIGDVVDSKPFNGTCTITVSSTDEWTDVFDKEIYQIYLDARKPI